MTNQAAERRLFERLPKEPTKLRLIIAALRVASKFGSEHLQEKYANLAEELQQQCKKK